MNQTNQYIFNLYHYLLTLRDTLEYTIDREHSKQLFEQRKEILTKGKMPGSHLGNFFENNKEQSEKLNTQLDEFINEIYGDDSNVLIVSGENVRVDHTQNIKIFDYVAGLSESVRDIVYGYLNYAKQQNQTEELIVNLLKNDDKLYRSVYAMLGMREFHKSFTEFQKVMGESKGQPTPQSNFIVQNEIIKLKNSILFVRDHHHTTDTEVLEALDKAFALIEMTEGKRDRKDNKPFNELFDELNKALNEVVAKVEPEWKKSFQDCLDEMRNSKQEAAKA